MLLFFVQTHIMMTGQWMPTFLTAFGLIALPLWAEENRIPEDLMDDPHVLEHLGVNEFTAPSIERIFKQLDQMGKLPLTEVPRELPEKMPLSRSDLALEIGFLIAEAFVQIQAGNSKDIEPIARKLQLYGRALGAGERVNRHAASLLENAAAGKLDQLKKELAATQRDVEAELVSLRDPDLAHLISLGGWARAFEVSSAAVEKDFSKEKAKQLFREDIADYFSVSVGSLDPRISEKPNMLTVRNLLSGMRSIMTLEENTVPTPREVKDVSKASKRLMGKILERQ